MTPNKNVTGHRGLKLDVLIDQHLYTIIYR